MRIKNTFLQGRMNKDSDERLVLNGQYRHAENIRVASSDGSDVGAIENMKGNEKLSYFDEGGGGVVKCLGMFASTYNDRLYWFLLNTNTSESSIAEYDESNGVYTKVAIDPTNTVLQFDENYLITGVNILIDSDNGIEFLLWTDGKTDPKMINIERVKAIASGSLELEDVLVIKAPPTTAPSINLGNTPSNEENNIEERFLRFAYRYEYLDGEKSALSSFSETAFLPQAFRYDYSTSSNESMINNFSEVNIEFDTGGKRVVAIDLVFKESGSNNVNLIESYKKSDQGWDDDTLVNIDFNNDKTAQVISENQLFRLYDAVPLSAQAQELIGNRIIYGNYVSDYDIVDGNGDAISMDFVLSKVSTAITNLTPTESVKSIRNYEVVMVYLDQYGRMTTGLPSKDNTTFIPNEDCINKNELRVTVKHKAPAFADRFRFFVKQSRYDYDTVVPTLFYEDGVYRWLKLEGNDIQKVREGDFLYVKADAREILNSVVQTKVLEVKDQDRNFLEDDTVTETEQLAGKYFKIKPSGYSINEEDFTNYEFTSYDSSSNRNDNPIRSNTNVIEPAVFYGTGLNDLTESGTYSNSTDIRYYIEIETSGTPDTFRWKEDEGGAWNSGVSITGAAQTLSNGVQVTFAATTGHTVGDYWIVSAKSSSDDGFGGSENSKAYALFKGPDTDTIEGGARITIIYDEYNEFTEYVEKSYVSSVRYANLEEWFFGDNIQADLGISASRIWFRRGNVGSDSGTEAKHITLDPAGDMTMIILSNGTQNNDVDARVKVRSTLNIFQSEQDIIFETKEKVESSDIFYEVGKTYGISGDNHVSLETGGTDTDQVFGSVDGVFTLPMFNCFAWGNGFESYKVKDSFNAVSMKIDTRPTGVIENYRRNNRIASLTYGEVYEQSTNYNGLNEFNQYLVNWKDMDDKYQSIQKLFTRDTDLTVYQEDKVHKVLYAKDILFDADGSGNVRQSTQVLGQEVAYSGEYGISLEPESHAFYGNAEYFTDSRRGVVLRKSLDGITEISNNGMRDWFRDSFRDNLRTKKIGAYDVFHDEYVLNIDDVESVLPYITNCGSRVGLFNPLTPFTYTVNVSPVTGDSTINYDISGGNIDIAVDNGTAVTNFNGLTGTGSVQYTQNQANVTELTVTVTVASGTPIIDITVGCIVEAIAPVVANDDSLNIISGGTQDVNVLNNDVFVLPVTVTVLTQPNEGTATVNPDKTIEYDHDGLNTNADSFTYQIDDGNTTDSATVNVTVQASGGGGGGTGQDFNISSDSYFSATSDGEGACGFLLDATKYHDGASLYPTLADTVYNDINKTSLFNGQNKYWRIGLGRTIRITSSGVVTDVWICGAGNA